MSFAAPKRHTKRLAGRPSGEIRKRFSKETKGLKGAEVEARFKAEVEAIIERELPRKEAGQMAKDIERLTPNVGKRFTPVRIDDKPAKVTAGRRTTRVIGVTPSDVSHTSIIRAASDQGVNFGMMKLDITQKDLQQLAEELAKLLKRE